MLENEKAISELKEDIRRLKKLIENHIGDAGEDTHALAQQWLPGFTDYNSFMMGKNRRVILPIDTDVLTAPHGRWECYTNVNTPNGEKAIWDIDVVAGASGRKEIIVTQHGTGKRYSRFFHTGGVEVDPKVWVKIPRELTLWSGSATKLNEELVLTHRLGIFDTIRIEYDCVGNIYSATREPSKIADVALPGTNVPDAASEDGMAIYEAQLAYSNVNNIPKYKITRVVGYWNGKSSLVPENPFTISRIVGIM